MDSSKASMVKTLVFPWAAHGHVSPFLQLSHKLAITERFDVYFCSTPTILASIKRQCDPKIKFIELPLPTLPDLPPQLHTTTNLPPHLIPTLIKAFQMSEPQFATTLDDLHPDLLIYDFFQPWAAKRAAPMGIPAVLFYVMGGASVAFGHHTESFKNVDDCGFPFPEIYMTACEARGVAVSLEKAAIHVEDSEVFMLGAWKHSCGVILINSSRGVDGKYCDYWSQLCHKKVVPVGALVREPATKEGGSEILQWLDGKERPSVVYISFGSENYFSEDQIAEVAKGLELVSNNVGFIWAARSPVGATGGEVPDEFVRRNKDRGLVLRGWAPQAAILAHPSVGAFMTHCGWNAIMEGIYFGVPMVAMPLQLDQPLSGRMAVGHGIAVEVAKDDDGKFDGEELAKAINEVMMERGEEMRSKVRKMSDKVRSDKEDEFGEALEDLARLGRRKVV